MLRRAWVVGLLVMGALSQAQEPVSVAGWTLVDVRDIYVETDGWFRGQASLAPDSSAIAYVEGPALCLYGLEERTTRCTPFPEGSQLSGMSRLDGLMWSPDSRFIAQVPDYFASPDEPDVWLFDVGAQTFRNLTDDGLERVFSDSGTATATIDVQPFWGPDGALYFVRSAFAADLPLTLMRYDPAADDSGEWAVVPPDMGTVPNILFPGFNPTGDAVVYTWLEADPDSERNGLYTQREGGDPYQLARLADFIALLPEWMGITSGMLLNPAWTEEGIFTVFSASVTDHFLQVEVVFHIEPETGALRLLNDFSAYSSVEEYRSAPTEETLPLQMPFIVVTRDGAAVFALAYSIEQEVMTVAGISGQRREPMVRLTGDTFPVGSLIARYRRIEPALQPLNPQNQVLLGGLLLTFEPSGR